MTETIATMSYTAKYINFQDELWEEFEALVRIGAEFPQYVDVTYPIGINPKGLTKDTEGRSSFLAKELIANPNYNIRPDLGPKDLLVEVNHVTFIDTEGQKRKLEPDIPDLYWICELLDGSKKNKN